MLGEKIKLYRENKKMTQLEIAEILGVKPTTISKYESGALEPNIESLKKLAELFETSIDGLLKENDFEISSINILEVLREQKSMKLKGTKQKCSIVTMGYVNDLDAIRRSSNIYQFKIALRVAGVNYSYDGPAYVDSTAFETYRKYLGLFGLGEKTGIDFPIESTGIKGKLENAGLLMNLAIGQYDSYTNIELNQYIATLANGNNRYSLHFLKDIKNGDEVIKTYEPVILNTLDTIDKQYIDRVKIGLKQVVSNGTGRGYIDESKNASGKTGTSETFVDTNGDGIYETESISTAFVSYLPSDNPKYALSITTPNISYVNSASSYIYPFNKIVIRRITDNLN